MSNSVAQRSWITPLVASAFLLVGGTGLLMLFHVKNGALVTIHEWLGLAFVAAGVLHLVINWRAFANRVKTPAFAAVLALVLACGVGLAVNGLNRAPRNAAGSGQGYGQGAHYGGGAGHGYGR